MSPEERGRLENVLDIWVKNLDGFLREFQIEKNEATISAFFAGSAIAFFSSMKADDKKMPPTQEDIQGLKKIVDSRLKSIPLY